MLGAGGRGTDLGQPARDRHRADAAPHLRRRVLAGAPARPQPHGARRIVQALALAGLAYAAYGLLVFLLDLNMVLWWRKWTWMTGVTSSFVNRNSYATYAGLGLLCAVGLLITTVYRDWRSRRFRRLPWRVRLMRITWRGWWLVGGAVCLAFALILTRSRGGVASSAAGLAVLVASFGATRLMRRRDVLITGGLALALAVGVFVLGGDDLVDASSARASRASRASRPTSGSSTRSAMRPGSAPATAPSPRCSAATRAAPRNAFWNHAHNTYLENALELGVPAAAALVGGDRLARLPVRAQPAAPARNALYPCLGIAATVLVGLHALLDFSLEIPAVAVTYAAIMGVACGRARARRPPAEREPQAPRLARSAGARGRARRGDRDRDPRARRAAARRGAHRAARAAGRCASSMAGWRCRPAALDRAIEAGRRAAAWADAGAELVARRAGGAGARRNARACRRGRAAAGWSGRTRPSARRSRTPPPTRRPGRSSPMSPCCSAATPPTSSGALTLSVLTGPSFGGVMPLRSGRRGARLGAARPADPGLVRARSSSRPCAFAPQPFVEAIRRSDGRERGPSAARGRAGAGARVRAPAADPGAPLTRRTPPLARAASFVRLMSVQPGAGFLAECAAHVALS